MIVLVDLKDQELEAKGCGACSGSSSDNKIRAKREDAHEAMTSPETAEEKRYASTGRTA
jgi:hypothetical protein